MGEYKDITLDRDRAFDINNLNELLTQGKSILTEAISISQKMETSISAISGIYSGIDGEYKVGALGSDIASLSGTLKKDVYQNTIDRMDKILNKLINDMPSYDNSLAQSMSSIQEVLGSVKGRISELRGLLETGDVNLSYTEFRQKLEDLKAGWDEITEDLAELLAEIENDMLGVSLKAILYSRDPVNLSTGNFVYDREDIKINGEIPLFFHRYYNSKDRIKGSMGRCFVHNYESYLEENEEKGKITISMEDGQKKTFRKMEDGTYQSLHSATETLTKEGNNYILTKLTGEIIAYNGVGQMTRQENRYGKGITFSYTEKGRLKKAETDNKTFLTYNYNEAGQLIRVIDHTGRSVELSYERGKLVTVKNPSGNTCAYRYGKNGRIEETVNSRGYVAVKNTYDEKRRITRQEFPDGGHMEYVYDDSKRQIILTERNGSSTTYIHDSKYRNTDILYEDGTKEHFEYNGKNQRILHIDRNGNSTRMAYDNRGNLVQVINALGEKINLTYNADNQLAILKINGKEKLRNRYDKKGNMISSIGADGKGNLISYDEQGRPVCIENADKSITKLTYDSKGNIEKIRDANGIEMCYEYDSLNRVCRTIDGNGNSTLFEFDADDRIVKVTNSLGDSRSYNYNESGKITRVTDYDGFNVRLEYNGLNKPQTIIDKEGNITHFCYDRMWNISELQQANGGIYRYEYDADNRLKEKHFPEGGYISYIYDGNGNCISETDAEGNKTSFIYDALNRMTDIQAPDGTGKHYKYDSEGNLESMMDALGNCIRYTYDEMGRRTSETDVLGNRTVFEYTAAGKIEKIIYPNGTMEKYVYQNGLLKNVYKTDGNSLQYKYDGNGNIISVIDGMGKEIRYTYDALNRVISQVTAEGNKIFQYDSIGNLKQFIDENGNTTDYEYSPNGNLKKVTDALGNETNYFYDCMGNLIKIEKTGEKQDFIGQDKIVGNNNNQTTIYEWNLDGQIIKVTDPAGDVEHYAYDKNGRITKKWDKENFCTTFHYGNTGDLTEILYGDGRSVLLSYDALHHLEAVKDWNGTTKIISDALGRTLSVTEPDGRTVSYEWGTESEKRVLTYPNGKKAEYSYNSSGLLERLTTEKGSIKYKYDAMGRLSKKELSNGIITSYTYNEMGRVQQICHNGEKFSEIYKYYYDAVGNKILIEKNRNGMKADDGRFSYNYDALNRLVQVTRDGKLLRKYDYDAFGNRIIKKEYEDKTERIIQYRYNEKNQLIAEIDNGIERNYRYDQRGNMTEVSIGEKMIKQFTFDATNRMCSSAEIVGSIIKKAEYRYNGLGQRVGQNIWRMEGSTDTVEILADESILGKPEEKIRYTLDLTRAYHNVLCLKTEDKEQTFYWDDNVTAMEECGTENYYIQDVLGSPMHLMDERGKSREIYGYDEFGMSFHKKIGQFEVKNRLITSEDIFQSPLQPFGFTGYQMDEVGGLYFAQARRYDASLGRFISEDFLKGFIAAPFTLNHYGYCWNRPLDLVDLDGQIPTWLKVVGTVAAVAVVATIAVVAAPATAAAVVVTATVAGAAVGGVVGGVTNVATGSGSFINGFAGGAVNGAVSVGLAFAVSPYVSNAAGGAAGSLITDALNNSDKSEEEQKSPGEMGWSAFVASVTQSLVGGSLGKLWGSATGGWNIANTTGASMVATALWDTLFAGGISFSTGAIASIVSSESWKAFLDSIGVSDDNAVKE